MKQRFCPIELGNSISNHLHLLPIRVDFLNILILQILDNDAPFLFLSCIQSFAPKILYFLADIDYSFLGGYFGGGHAALS